MTKKTFMICAALIGFTSVGAAEITTDPLTVYTEDNAIQLQSEYQEDLAQMTELQQHRRRGDRDHRRDDRGRVRHRPPHYRPIPIPIPLPYGYYTCFARNNRGRLFSATSNRRGIAQRRAIQRCYNSSRVCRPAGCRVY